MKFYKIKYNRRETNKIFLKKQMNNNYADV